MSEARDWPVDAIALFATPGLIETLFGLDERDGQASLAELRAAGITDPLRPLRTLAAGGHVAGPGTFDNTITEVTLFSLTYSGLGLTRTLREFVSLGNDPSRPQTRRGSRRPPRWRLRGLGFLRRVGSPRA
jgi:hypothetical protein